ncbi:hypothetical protein [Enteractinococcus helveticum]|uniref:Uncharacterized protein n=1 Tax=Enteractinococcus helveticum TaxID=1837282 RepID=A0A1B7M2J9_9MICC|nr:hypothetical protein [Enteractinococcus helveticum]OAV62828.1 hypothetical protein A6F49_04800 [Enteractinococcus helveticum]
MTSDLQDLTVGDEVVVNRNLEHPVNMHFVDDAYGGGWVPKDGVEETIGTKTVTERRDIPAMGGPGGWRHRPARSLVRLGRGFWYDLSDGYQDGSKATVIETLGTLSV